MDIEHSRGAVSGQIIIVALYVLVDVCPIIESPFPVQFYSPRRVQALTRTAPVYTVKWRSQVVRPNTRTHPTQASNVVSLASRHTPQLLTISGRNPVVVNSLAVVVIHVLRKFSTRPLAL